MLWNFDLWIDELRKNASAIREGIEEMREDRGSIPPAVWFRIERSLLLTAIAIRKLTDQCEYRDECLVYKFGVFRQRIKGDKAAIREAVSRGSVYWTPLEFGETDIQWKTMRQLCNIFIHTPTITYHGIDDKTFFFQGHDESDIRYLYSIKFDTWIRMIDNAAAIIAGEPGVNPEAYLSEMSSCP